MTFVSLYKTKRPARGSPKRKVWQLRWMGTDGKRYCDTVGEVGKITKREAEALQRRKQSAFDAGLTGPDRPKRVTLGQFLILDREAIQADVRPTTLKEYGHAGRHACDALGEHIRLDRIGPAEVGKVKRHLQQLGRSPATVRKTITSMSAMLGRAMRQGLIRENPFAGQAKGKTQSKRKRIFRPHEVEAMLAACPTQWWRVFIKVAVTTGLRKSELLNLVWADIDFDARTVTVSRKDAGVFEIQDVDYPILPWSTKTHEERSVPVTDDTLELLTRFRLRSGDSRYLFLSLARLSAIQERMAHDSWNPNCRMMNNLNRDFEVIQRHAHRMLAEKRGVELADVEWSIGCIHDLRRTYSTEMARVVPIHVLCTWPGHASMETTRDFYLAADERDSDSGRAAMTRLYNRQTDAQLTRTGDSAVGAAATGTENDLADTINADSARSSAG